MTWAAKRQIIYFLAFMAVVIVVVGIPLFAIYYKAPTCFDNKQNGGEQGVDCGGVCTRLCKEYVAEPVVVWQKAFEVTPGWYSAVAYIQNPNVNAEAEKVPYTFTFRDSNNAVVGTRKGAVYIPPGKNFAIFESGIQLSQVSGTVRTSFEFDGEFDWMNKNPSTDVVVKNMSVDGLSNNPTITADLYNSGQNSYGRINVTAIVYDTEGNAVGASKTYVESLKKQSTSHIAFTWPAPFSGQVTSCQEPTDVVLAVDRSGSMSSDGKNPPEPLTSVKNAADTFVNGLSSKDKAAVISFATDASKPIDQVLTSDKISLREAIDSIEIGTNGLQYTNIADAIKSSVDELMSGRHESTSKQAIVLLTDGEPTKPEVKGNASYPSDAALAAARDAQSKGIDIYTIGLGNEVKDDFLKSVAGLEEHYFKAPKKEDLASVYAKISASMCKLGPAKVEIIPDILPQ